MFVPARRCCLDIATTTVTLKSIAMLLMAVLPVSVKTNSGETIEGNFSGFGPAQIRIEVSGQSQSVSFDDLSSLTPDSVEQQTGPTFRVTLVNGSRIAAQDLSLAAGELIIQPRRQASIPVPVKQVKAIRFRSANTASDAQWLGIVGQESRGDTLVIRRGDDRLDPQDGIIEAIADGKVVFDIDGDKVNAPIEKLEGIVFGGNQPESENAEILVTDVFGSQWSLAAIRASEADQPLDMQINDTLSHSLPLEQIESIRWSGGLVLLATVQPATSSVVPYIQTKLDPKLIEKFFTPKTIGSADLIASGGTIIEYRIESGYRTLAGTVQRLASVRNGSKLLVQIDLDGKTVWEQELVDSEPRGFELPVGDARRVSIKVNNGADGDLGDTVHIVRPRLTK